MSKLTFRCIKIKSPGSQLKKIIIDEFGSINDFAKKIDRHPRTVRQYLKEKRLGSDTFKIRVSNIFNKGFKEIIKSEEDQIREMVQNIYENIKMYIAREDIYMFEKLKDLCVEYDLYIETIIMQRNMAILYLYKNQIDKAIGFMEASINTVRISNYSIKWKSELGLMYFYGCEYKKSKKLFEEVEDLLSEARGVDERTVFLHYYRYGLLSNNTNKYPLAEKLFEKSLEYTKIQAEIGSSIMNIGISYKKRKKYKRALEYYNRALDIFEDNLNRSILLNHLAELYKCRRNYERALYYSKLALRCGADNDLESLFIYYQTYAEILICKNEFSGAKDKLFEFIDRIESNFFRKKFIKEGISAVVEYGKNNRDIDILEDIEDLIIRIIKKANKNIITQSILKELPLYKFL